MGVKLRLSLVNHGFVALQGILLFGCNYWLIYLAEIELVSAIVAMIFTSLIFFNMLFEKIFLKTQIEPKVIVGAIIGMLGLACIFWQDVSANMQAELAVVYAFLATIIASLGNIVASRNNRQMPIIVSLFWGMLYGSICLFVLSLLFVSHWTIDFSLGYISSLLYLSLFGSVLAFWLYIKLMGNIGATKASYMSLLVPVFALIISYFFESLELEVMMLVGFILLLLGGYLALATKQPMKQ